MGREIVSGGSFCMTDDFIDVIQNEARLDALRRTSLFDSPPEEAFDRLTRMAASVLRVPVALVNLVGSDSTKADN